MTQSPTSSFAAPDFWVEYTVGPTSDEEQLSAVEKTISRKVTADSILKCLFLGEQFGEDKVRHLLESLAPTDDPALTHWCQVEIDFVADPSNYEARYHRLEQLGEIDLQNQHSWVAIRSEARRQLLMASAHARSAGRDFDRAIAHLDSALALFRQLDTHDDGFDYASVFLVRGRVSSWRGNLGEAVRQLTLALLLYTTLGHEVRLAAVAYELAVAYRDLRYLDEGEPLFQFAAQIANKRADGPFQAKVNQATAMLHLARARSAINIGDRDARAEQHAEAFAMDALHVSTASPNTNFTGKRAPNGFRAGMAARDLAELALLRGEEDAAHTWLKRAATELGLDLGATPDPSVSLNDGTSTLSIALREQNIDRAAKLAREQSSFDQMRLSEISSRLALPNSTEDEGDDLDRLAKFWLLRQEEPYAIDAFLAAAHRRNARRLKLSTERAAHEETGLSGDSLTLTLGAEKSQYSALLLAEQIGADLEGLNLTPRRLKLDSRNDLNDSLAAHNVSIAQALYLSGRADVYRVATSRAYPNHRIIVIRDPAYGLSADQFPERLQSLRRLSRDEDSVPTISTFDVFENGYWIIDENIQAQTLQNALESVGEIEAWTIVMRLCEVVRKLIKHFEPHDLAIGLVPDSILVLPGGTPVITRHELSPSAALMLRNSDRFYRSLKPTQGEDGRALATIILRWVLSAPTLSTEDAQKRLKRGRFVSDRNSPIGALPKAMNEAFLGLFELSSKTNKPANVLGALEDLTDAIAAYINTRI